MAAPTFGAHALVNLPAAKKFVQPHAAHVDVEQMPEFRSAGVPVRVVVGETNGLRSDAALAEPFTLLDGIVQPQAEFRHMLKPGWGAMMHVVRGRPQFFCAGGARRMIGGQHAVGIALPKSAGATELCFAAGNDEASHL